MPKSIHLLKALLLLAFGLFAQTNTDLQFVTTTPAGACTNRAQPRILVPSGNIYVCDANVWTLKAAGSTIPGTPVNTVQFNSPLGTFAGNANFLFDGSRLGIGPNALTDPAGPGSRLDVRDTVTITTDTSLAIMHKTVTPTSACCSNNQGQLATFLLEYNGTQNINASAVFNDLEINNTAGIIGGLGAPVVSTWNAANMNSTETDAWLAAEANMPTLFTGTAHQLMGSWNYLGLYAGSVDTAAHFYAAKPVTGAKTFGLFSFYSEGMCDVASYNAPIWVGETGVYRVKADKSFNGACQGIAAVYNPQVAAYTPNAVNYERLIEGEYNSNVAELGSYAGGTGTVRDLRLLTGPTLHFGTASNIGSVTFTGVGVNDATFGGTYTGATLTYCAIIDGTGATDTFKWGTNGTCDNGATGVAILGPILPGEPGQPQALSGGVEILWATKTGHTLADKWSTTATAAADYATMASTGEGLPILTFATLGTPANSTLVYCSDCTNTSNLVAGNTCANTGSGALAIRVNGVWKCFL